ncbi:MAG: XkdF-like putative serine protease domain-containing protein [Dermatophilaceae bacterium]
MTTSLPSITTSPDPDDDELTPSLVVKALGMSDGEQRFSLAVAYPADRVDGHGEYASPQTVEKAAWDYLAEHRQVGLFHADGIIGQGTVVESMVWRGPDWALEATDGSTQLIKAGDWLLGTVWEPDAWRLIKSGRVNGMSIQGIASHRHREGVV